MINDFLSLCLSVSLFVIFLRNCFLDFYDFLHDAWCQQSDYGNIAMNEYFHQILFGKSKFTI